MAARACGRWSCTRCRHQLTYPVTRLPTRLAVGARGIGKCGSEGWASVNMQAIVMFLSPLGGEQQEMGKKSAGAGDAQLGLIGQDAELTADARHDLDHMLELLGRMRRTDRAAQQRHAVGRGRR